MIRAILIGGLIAGILDIADAFIFFGLRGVSPVRILHAIASGLLGRSAFGGGYPVAAFGLAIHFAIALSWAGLFAFIARQTRRHAVLSGLLYGLFVYAAMNLVVLPLSKAGIGAYPAPILINGILIHMFGVGLPISLAHRFR